MPSRSCIVSFTDPEGIEHSVRVSAASLYEAAVFSDGGISAARFCGYDVWTSDEIDCEDSGTRNVAHGERQSVKVLARWRRKKSG